MNAPRPPYRWAALAGAAAFALYALTLAPTTWFWDTSEYIATAHILGIPHPPGNPLFVVLARSWSVLLAPTGLPVAVRINLLAALTTSVAVAFMYLVGHRVAAPLAGSRAGAHLGGAASALVAATAFTVWNQANVNEKVYTISVMIIAAVTWLAIRWRDRRDEPGSERLLVAAVFLMALGSTNHLMSVLPFGAVAILVLLTRPGVLLRPAVLTRSLAAVVVGLSFNFFLPVRAAQEPVINEGHPTCASAGSAALAIYSNGAAGCPALAYNLTRQQYRKPPVTQRMAPLRAQLQNYAQYFDWQWARGAAASEQPGTERLPVTLLFLLLGLAGLWAAWRADRVVFAYLLVLTSTLTVGLVYYLNFKYGYSLAPEVTDRALHEVRERDYFFVASFLVWGALVGMGLAWCVASLGSLARGDGGRRFASALYVVAFLPLVLNWRWADRSGDWAARDWAYDLLMSVEPYGILFTNGDNDTFPLWYVQEVEGVRRDVTVVVGQYLYTPWYPRQLQKLTTPEHQRRFQAPDAPGLYEEPPPPSRPIVSLTPEQMDGVGAVRLDRDLTIPFPGLAVTYPAGMTLDRAEQLTLSMIHDSLDERPIYFAAPGGMMAELGLTDWGVRQGLVTKLVLRDPDGPLPAGVVRGTPEYGGESFDLERSLRLYREIYGYRGLRERAVWADRSTLNIPWHFYAMALQLSDVARQAGKDEELVRALEEDARAFDVVAQGGYLGSPPEG